MNNILNTIADAARERVAAAKGRESLNSLARRASEIKIDDKFAFERALKGGDISFICEIKKASPSKGVIAEVFPYLDIASEYEKAGAAAISVLTEPGFFMGLDEHLRRVASRVSVPVLRKDFTVDLYQIYEAKMLGASAVLLICSLLSAEELKEYICAADELGLSCLVEIRDPVQAEAALEAGARVIGVNNRNLATFEVDVLNSARLRPLVPEDKIFVAESGIKTREDVQALRSIKADAVLIGETLMRCPDKAAALQHLRSGGNGAY